ncbi:hypothetical protein [uncultured Desulfovibrio sp.]|uniref:hypothetical protein n=1 Tax=uncultured Desulfovibrio sp. TaxID=167968 RepID=UPI0004802538|nr:hypothetical protein [uncultured Desulfovibrio sp.]
MKLTDVGIRRVNGNGKAQKLSEGGGLFLYVTPAGNAPCDSLRWFLSGRASLRMRNGRKSTLKKVEWRILAAR